MTKYGRNQRVEQHAAMWPGITRGFDARCAGCSWAMRDGVYQVKARDVMCRVHGGDLGAALRRMERARGITPAQAAGDGGRWDGA